MVIQYPSYEAVIETHKRVVKASGGTGGVLSTSNLHYLLDAARDVGRGAERDKLISKTAYILHNIVTLHPFIDGNKRTAFETAKAFFQLNGEDFEAEDDESFNMLISVAIGELSTRDVEVWIRKHLKQRPE